MLKLEILGRPATKKTSPRIFAICPKGCPGQAVNVTMKRQGRKPFRPATRVLPSESYERYEQDALKQLMKWGNVNIKEKVRIDALYWLPNLAHWPDLSGLFQATADILERAGIIENDRLITSWGDSQICGIDKERPRVEILITTME